MSDMSGMGMDSSSVEVFTPSNSAVARTYWWIITSLLGLGFIVRTISRASHRFR